ncbi:MAG TPA: hypothetical protein VEQ66_07755 [Propionibacteriaceae bacterium]|nr:hypothetical protein [Propionibacteriaceae bacterium]
MAVLVGWLVGLWAALPLGAPSSPAPVYPTQGNGFASWIVGGFFGLGVLVLFAIWTSRRPKRPS